MKVDLHTVEKQKLLEKLWAEPCQAQRRQIWIRVLEIEQCQRQRARRGQP